VVTKLVHAEYWHWVLSLGVQVLPELTFEKLEKVPMTGMHSLAVCTE
jgi:hypothetical protein